MLSVFSTLDKALNLKKENYVNVISKSIPYNFELPNLCIIKYDTNLHIIKYDPYHNIYIIYSNDFNGKLFLNKNQTMIFLLSLNIISIHINKKIIYLKGIDIIQRRYRKYLLRTARIRNDLIIHGLMEKWYHPSKLCFEI